MEHVEDSSSASAKFCFLGSLKINFGEFIVKILELLSAGVVILTLWHLHSKLILEFDENSISRADSARRV